MTRQRSNILSVKLKLLRNITLTGQRSNILSVKLKSLRNITMTGQRSNIVSNTKIIENYYYYLLLSWVFQNYYCWVFVGLFALVINSQTHYDCSQF